MTWRAPTKLEEFLLADTRERWPEVLPLARLLCLAPRIEPLLLRNARRRYLTGSPAELESRLWFSPIVADRSTSEIVLHLGVAKVLVDDLLSKARQQRQANPCADTVLDELWRFTRRHTRHWSAEDRLERDLRFYALQDDQFGLRRGLGAILKRIQSEKSDETRRIDLSRLAKRLLPVVASSGSSAPAEEARVLTQYAALALGDTGSWVEPGSPQALPEALAETLPSTSESTELGLELRWEPDPGLVLSLVDAADAEWRIRFPGPLPARLNVAPEGRVGEWRDVTHGTRIRIDPPSGRLRLTTLDGLRWDLSTDALPADAGPQTTQEPLRLTYVEADREQAEVIAKWLLGAGVQVELRVETENTLGDGNAATQARAVRLWSRAARAFWADQPLRQTAAFQEGLLLRIDDVDPPSTGAGPGRVLDWRDLSRLVDSPEAKRLLRSLQRWRDGAQIEPEPEPESEPGPGEAGEAVYSDEIAALLAEIDDPKTEPPRRLEIGDRLAALGDPRPGVGVVEIEVPLEDAGETGAEQQRFPPEVQRLLDEIDDPATEPPRRLEIGDELERRGDPRPGVGVVENGLPDIDWVEIPGGPFIYQDGEPRNLPTFWIARYPVTNRQFQAFIDAGGYRQERWWRDLERPEPKTPTWQQDNRPRTDMNWYEAVAFTRWLTAQLGLPGDSVRLPTEFEWEKTARGEEGPIYPWGDEYRSGFANINETAKKDGPWYLTQTTAVGMFPQGRSPYGIEDLAGNVWEWCLNKHDKPAARRVDTSGDSRCLRGGSWVLSSVGARAGNRVRARPEYRDDDGGFRVLSSVPIPAR